ncbi:MAG: sulfate ABC transporter permease, partial [Candidatus Eremiobacteraeota bacterium]|nr:sulfate ABC transporter permease [Candidatus Eremiobacteraeota bacterium]
MRGALVLLLALFMAPILNLALAVPPGAVVRALSAPHTLAAMRVSLAASVTAIAVATLLGVPAAYALARAGERVRGIGLFLLALPLALPPIASGMLLLGTFGERKPVGAWLYAHGAGIVDTFLG